MSVAARNVVAATVLMAIWCGGCAQTGGRAPQGGAIETYVKGVYAYRAGSPEAIETLRQAIQENPQLIMPRVILGKIYKDQGDYASAIEYFDSLTQLDPYDPEHRYNLGVSYQMIQRLQEAAKSYQAALKLNPNDFGSHMNLGLVYLALGDVQKALRHSERAVELRPNSSEAQSNLAVVLDSAGEHVRAENAYRRALELAPPQPGVLINYANNLLLQQKWEDALQVLNETLKLEDTPYLHKRIGDAYTQGARYDEAIKEYRVALQRNPRYFAAMNEQGRALILQYQAGMELEDRKRDEALALWRQSLEISPNQPKIQALLEQWEKKMFSK